MKEIKIRFIEQTTSQGVWFSIEKKRGLGWVKLGYLVDMGYGGVCYQYSNQSKEALLEEVLEKHFKTCKKLVKIVEHPTIKIY